MLVRKHESHGADAVRFRQLWGKEKLAELLQSKQHDGKQLYENVTPEIALGLPFAPMQVDASYLAWPLLPDLFPVSFPGVKTSRDELVVDIDKNVLTNRMKQYFDKEISHEEMREISAVAMAATGGFEPEKTRDFLRNRGFVPQSLVAYSYRPFDLRWLYWEPETKLLDRNRAEYVLHVNKKNLWFTATQQNRKEFDPPTTTRALSSLHIIERGANLFPLYLQSKQSLLVGARRIVNLSDYADGYLRLLRASPKRLFHHVIEIGRAHV